MENFRESDPSLFKAPEQSKPEQPSKLKEYLKKAVIKTAAFSMMFGTHMVGYAQTQSTETRARFAPMPNAEKVEKKRPSFNPAEIRSTLRTDPHERIFINTDIDSENQLFELSGGGTTSGYLDYEEIDRVLAEKNSKVTKLKVAHTHPQEAYSNVFFDGGVTKKDQYEYQQGIKELPPHPPSMPDFQSEYNLQKYFGKRNITVASEVIDASGVWDYTVDNNSTLLKDLAASEEEYSKALDEKLSEGQWNIMTSTLESGRVDPRLLSTFLKNETEAEDPTGANRKLGETLSSLQNQTETKYKAAVGIYREIGISGTKVILAKSVEERTVAITSYIDLCAKHGIKVTYTPAIIK